ncbi:MFS transporter [Ammoniphilus sp. CFH 90114]|uniref:MFS transporter n=1 Tax=Ammoniphilus sp. CFH 90114 TaxID=2493665 RepID=UPI00100E50A7|nr:MFS transporter [Ammoniphilus sp. CFH 90114]RXT03828.1 MFS transporter [Ammoniphilus sp. CFH 90114]
MNANRLIPLLSFIIFFSVMNGTMFNVAIPAIAEQFQLLPSEVSWVVAGYIVFFAIGSVTYGKLADIYPVKDLITTGLILFNVGSLLGFLSQWYGMLIVARLIQATGAASIPALGMITATRYFPPESRGKVLGVIASTVAFASGVGPIVGGFITGAMHWRYLFLLSLISLVAISFLRKQLPDEERNKQAHFDKLGAVYLSLGVTGILLYFSQLSWPYLFLGVVFICLFILHIRRAKDPFINASLFLNRSYRNGLITGFLTVGTVFGMMFLIPIMLQEVNGLESAKIGLTMFPGAMSAAVFGTISGRLADRIGSVPIVKAGIGILMIGYLLLSTFAGSHQWVMAAILVICYLGFSGIQSSLANTVSHTLSREQIGVGMGMYNLVFFMSGAFGSTIVGKILDFSSAGSSWNPWAVSHQGAVYSNIFLLFLVIIVISFAVFFVTFSVQRRIVSEAK